MYCTNPNCENVIDLRGPWIPDNDLEKQGCCCCARQGKLLVCAACKNRMCGKCRQPYHGERTKCQKWNELGAWKNKKSMFHVANCPDCATVIEKNEGCPHMTCIVCKYYFCWVCGTSPNNVLHKRLIMEIFCSVLNDLFKCNVSSWLIYMLFIVLSLIFPAVAIPLAVISMPFVLMN